MVVKHMDANMYMKHGGKAGAKKINENVLLYMRK